MFYLIALSFPEHWSFANFAEAMRVTDFWNSLGNSLLITVITVVLAILIHGLAGYAIGRSMKNSKFYNVAYLYIVSGMFVPFAILMMPLVKQTAQMGIANRFGVMVLYTVFYMPINLMLYKGYLTNIPIALEEAARVDGTSTWMTYWKIVFPIMKPMHATVAVLTAMSTWNDVMTPLVIMSGTGKNTLPLAQLNFQTQFGTNYNLAFASYLLALIPILIFYIICQKQIMRAKRQAVPHAATDRHGAFGDHGGVHRPRGDRGQAQARKFVYLFAGVGAAKVAGARQLRRHKIDDEATALPDEAVRMALRPHRNIRDRRAGTTDARPGYGDDVGRVCGTAGDHYRRHGAEQGAALPLYFSGEKRGGFVSFFHILFFSILSMANFGFEGKPLFR